MHTCASIVVMYVQFAFVGSWSNGDYKMSHLSSFPYLFYFFCLMLEVRRGGARNLFFSLLGEANHANLYKNLIKIQIFNVNLGSIGTGPCPPPSTPLTTRLLILKKKVNTQASAHAGVVCRSVRVVGDRDKWLGGRIGVSFCLLIGMERVNYVITSMTFHQQKILDTISEQDTAIYTWAKVYISLAISAWGLEQRQTTQDS